MKAPSSCQNGKVTRGLRLFERAMMALNPVVKFLACSGRRVAFGLERSV